MKSTGVVKVFAIALALVCAYQLIFTWKTNQIEGKAKAYAKGDKAKERAYIDSIAREPVLMSFTYLDCKERELNLGLDLQGGMNVTLEVSLSDLVLALSNNNQDPIFNKALANANEKLKTSQKDYVTLFGEAYAELSPSGKLATIFATKENKDKVSYTSTNAEVLKFISGEADQAIDRSFQILRARIDKFGVTQPNIQKLGNSGRILVELPGVDNPERVRKLLQGSARLQFWETYDNTEAFGYLQTANTTIAKLNAANDMGDKKETATDAADSSKSSTEGLELLQTNKAASDTSKKSTDLTAAANDTSKAGKDSTDKKSQEQLIKENPLLYTLLIPATNENRTELVKGSIVGSALIKDTAKINAYLNTPEVLNALPSTIKFLWEAKGLGKNEEVLRLHAIRFSKTGGAALEGDVVTDARKDISQSGNVEISMTMNTSGARQWKKVTGGNIGKCVAIVLDDRVYSAPTVQSEIPNGHSSISGNFTTKEADDLANILKSGKLPAPTRIVAEAVVGPTLGQEAISSGFSSFAIALVLVLVFMGFYYNKAGWVADIALFVNVFFVIGVLASLGAVLTLPGIAGVVLTIGMSVDANILIFERIREEMGHHGKSLKNAVSEGYAHAMSSILDSNITTLLLGIVLYVFGTGPIQGFATTLIIGILTSLFCAIFITRIIFDNMLEKGRDVTFYRKATQHVYDHFKIDFVGKRKLYYTFSTIIILIGVVFFVIRGGFNFGVDFKGGRTYVVRFDKTIPTTDVRQALGPFFDGKEPEVKTYGGSEQVKITTAYLIQDNSADAEAKVVGKLNEGLKKMNPNYEIVSSEKVGETISGDIKSKAIWAVIISCFIMFFYIILRFKKWQYGLGAVVALAHDVLIVLSIFLIFDGVLPFSLEIDQHFIAAILTVMGYSMTDTVVVFDRIREYLTIRNKSDLDTSERNTVINYALNSTLSRTINTSLTIFFVLVAIFIFGGETIRGFSFALLIGIVVGTYSSICVATPVVVDFEKKETK